MEFNESLLFLWNLKNLMNLYKRKMCRKYTPIYIFKNISQVAFICSNSTMETLEKGVKYVHN